MDFRVLSLAQLHDLTVLLCCAIFMFENIYSLKMILMKFSVTLTGGPNTEFKKCKCQEGTDIGSYHAGGRATGLCPCAIYLLSPSFSAIFTYYRKPLGRKRLRRDCTLFPLSDTLWRMFTYTWRWQRLLRRQQTGLFRPQVDSLGRGYKGFSKSNYLIIVKSWNKHLKCSTIRRLARHIFIALLRTIRVRYVLQNFSLNHFIK